MARDGWGCTDGGTVPVALTRSSGARSPGPVEDFGKEEPVMTAFVDGFVRDVNRTALVVIDMQNDFLLPGAPVCTPGGMDLVPVIADLAQAFRSAALPVVFTQEMHRSDMSDFGIELHFEPVHCLEGTSGMEIVSGLEPQPGDIRILGKRRYDAFLGTDLDLALRVRGVENLLVTGVCTDICVISTVYHARNLDYRCHVLRDAVAGTTPTRHDAALACMEHVSARVGTVAETSAAFGLTLTGSTQASGAG
jgi:nicotinamidase-related amidase